MIPPGAGVTVEIVGGRLPRNAQYHHRHECQGRRRQVDADPCTRRNPFGFSRQEDSCHRLRCAGQHQPHAAAPAAAGGAAGGRSDHRRLPDRHRAEGDAVGLAPLRDRRRVGRGRCTHHRPSPQRHQPHPVRARGLQGRPRNPPAQDGRRLPQGGAASLRLRFHRQRPRPVGAHRMLAARGRLLHLAHAARLHLDARPRLHAQVPPAQSRRWALPSCLA